MKKKIAVVLMNLGGPSTPQEVKPFLYRLFSDPAIIGLPDGLRQILAWIISTRRYKKAQKIYDRLGGGSPLLPNTIAQQHALEKALHKVDTDSIYKVFMAMRYAAPLTEICVDHVLDFNPDEVVLLPLYPQFSTTTTASSLAEWHRLMKAKKRNFPTVDLCCYPEEPGFVAAYQALIHQAIEKTKGADQGRILFSAHGIPQKCVDGGDPYEIHVKQSVEKIMEEFSQNHAICYQSKVGPLAWLGPSIDEELKRAAADNVGVFVVPVAFVSEHSETLVELDMDYKEQAAKLGLPFYERVPTVSDHPAFIAGLVHQIITRHKGKQQCAAACVKCWRYA